MVTGVLWYGGRLLAEGRLSMGELTSFLLYTFTLAFTIGAVAGLYPATSAARLAPTEALRA